MKEDNVVEILYTDACPFWKQTLKMIEEIVADLKAEASVKKVRVSNEKEAKKLRFPGSPTVRVNGVDIDPAAREAMESAGYIGCRIYRLKDGIYESPPKEMLKSGLERLIRK